ncbi:MAG: phospho-N-acetylmuramoyl-pentapeptide-transferase [Flavobacteriales bacterium]|nr:phospho-N-acetylmuramoyl-pentapeptide-transferase [Flavobacteriales bacterium]
MLYYLFRYLENSFHIPGAGAFEYSSFRAILAILLSLTISLVYGKRLIALLHKKQVGETIRQLGLEGENTKKGTPTMGGLIILAAIIIPTLLFARFRNIYIILMLVSTVWLGLIGFLDDYIKVFKKDKEGLAGRFKIIGQLGLGLIIGLTLYFNDEVVVREFVNQRNATPQIIENASHTTQNELGQTIYVLDQKSTATTIPFIKTHQFDYAEILFFLDKETAKKYAWIVYVLIVTFIIIAVSNAANLTDGIDGLAAGTSAIIGLTLVVLAYISGNAIFADYLKVMFIPFQSELVIFGAAFVGACIGFLWYNSYPAQVFMGDTGSLALGGIIAVFAIMLRKELLIPILCGIFLAENLSVVLQVGYFKYTKKKYGEGKRIFLMSPLHHHFQKKGYAEPKIVTRFWIVGIMLAALTIITFKLR